MFFGIMLALMYNYNINNKREFYNLNNLIIFVCSSANLKKSASSIFENKMKQHNY